LLNDDEEREWVRDLLTARHAGFDLNALQAHADRIISVVGQRAPRLAAWLQANRSPAEVVAFVEPGANDEQIVENFTVAGGLAKAAKGRGQGYGGGDHSEDVLSNGLTRAETYANNRRYSANGNRASLHRGLTPLRRAKLEQAEAALRAADGDLARAAMALGV